MHWYPGLTPDIIAEMAYAQYVVFIDEIGAVGLMLQGKEPPADVRRLRREIAEAKRTGKIMRMPDVRAKAR